MSAPHATCLPDDARRVVVRGTTGSGKTTLARQIASSYDIPHVELDALFHQPGWTTLPEAEFVARVAAATEGDRWVVCGNYSAVEGLVLERADTAVLYDLPRSLVMWRLVRRSLRRALRREVLWNGNREPWRNFYRLDDPSRSVIAWAWTTHRRRHEALAKLAASPPAHLRVVHVANREQERRLRAALSEREAATASSVAG